MPKEAGEPDKTVKLWMKRIQAAEKAKKDWETRYQVATCREYWTGNQLGEKDRDDKAVVNRIMPTIRTKLPGLFFYHPFARIEASPAKTDTPGQVIEDSTRLLQDTANTIIRDEMTGLMENVELGIKESFWAFGCAEVGYSAEFSDNPALKDTAPPLKEDDKTEGVTGASKPADPLADPLAILSAPEASEQPYQSMVKEECFWVRRIPARQVLCSATESTIVGENDWIGYYEYHNVEDVKKAPAYKNTKGLKGSSRSEDEENGDKTDTETSSDEVKLYKIWDQRTKTRYVIAEGHKGCLLKEPYKRRKLFFLRPEVEPDKFRPIPPIFNWIGSQDQSNNASEALRQDLITRVRRYTVQEDGILPEEMEKFESNDPNVWVKRRQNTSPDVIAPINQPSMSGEMVQMLEIARRDFDEVTGVGAEARQQAQSDTATQAAIMNQRQNITDTFDRNLVAKWLAEIVKELVELAIEKMTLPKWVQMNTDPYSPMAQQDAMVIAQQWQQITSGQMEKASNALRWKVSIDIESLSPVSEQEQAARWMQMLTIITNPTIAPLLAMSPEMLKRTLDLGGIKNGKDQAAIGQALGIQAQMQAAMAAQQAGAPPGVAPMPGGGGPPAPSPSGSPGPPQMIPGPPEGMVQ